MLGRDVAVQTSTLADATWDYVALGHIHRHQNLNPPGDPPVVYSGSLERIDFGEEEELKGFCWVELARGRTTWSFVPVAARRFITLQFDVRGDPAPMDAALRAVSQADVEESIVRLQIRMDAEQQTVLRDRELREALASAVSLTINREVAQEARARLGDLAPEALTPMQLIERYYLSRSETPERIQDLLRKAEELVRDSD
jgi:exonuclease SbcD